MLQVVLRVAVLFYSIILALQYSSAPRVHHIYDSIVSLCGCVCIFFFPAPVVDVFCTFRCFRRGKQASSASGAAAVVSDGGASSGGSGGGGGLGDRVARYGRVLLVTAVVAFKIVEWWNRVDTQVRYSA